VRRQVGSQVWELEGQQLSAEQQEVRQLVGMPLQELPWGPALVLVEGSSGQEPLPLHLGQPPLASSYAFSSPLGQSVPPASPQMVWEVLQAAVMRESQ